MNIHYDIFIHHPELANETTQDEDIFYKELLHFVEERLKPLKEEIDKEEQETNNDAVTIIYMLRDDDKFLGFHNYSIELRTKMLACFSQNDIVYIDSKIGQILQARQN